MGFYVKLSYNIINNGCNVILRWLILSMDESKKHTHEQISYNMRQVKSRDSKIELKLRKELWKRGLRYRKNVNCIFGKPDIAFITKRIVVFCDSEFWHGYNWEEKRKNFKSTQKFWINKIECNIKRDILVNEKLKNDGWKVLGFWGKDILKNTVECANIIESVVKGDK